VTRSPPTRGASSATQFCGAGLRLHQHCSGFSVSFAVNLHSMLPRMFLHEKQCADLTGHCSVACGACVLEVGMHMYQGTDADALSSNRHLLHTSDRHEERYLFHGVVHPETASTSHVRDMILQHLHG